MTTDDYNDNWKKTSRSKMVKTDICLFYDDDDGQEWCKYWKKMMSCSEVKLTIDACTTMISLHEFKAKVKKCKLLVILTTGNMLQFFQEDDSHFESLSKRTYISNIHCHTSKDDMESISALDRFVKRKTFVAEDEGHKNRSIVGDLLELIEMQATTRRTKMRKFKIMPSHVHEIGETIAVIFRTEVTGPVEISIGPDGMKHLAKKMNPFTYSFQIPDTCEVSGKSKLKVHTNGTYYGEHPIKLTLPTLEPYQCPAFLSQILGIPIHNEEALDKALVKVYQKSQPDDDALECILGDFYEDTPQRRSPHELPTLLHFAAKNGLSELCSLLLDTPGSLAAFQVENQHGLDPADLADKHGHSELCDYLRTFVDVEATVHACEDLYLEMSGRKIYENQQTLGMHEDPLSHSDKTSEDTFNTKIPPTPSRIQLRSTRRHSEPTPEPSRPPLPAPRKKQQPSAQEFMGMTSIQTRATGKSATLGCTGGSAAENDLIGIMSAVKDGEFTLNEAERLYESWKKQNSSSSRSIKERKQALDTLRKDYMSMFDIVKEQSKEKGIIKKLKNKLVKKKSQQNLNISTPTLLRNSRGTTQLAQDRSSGSSNGSRVSDISQVSASSFDMCGSESDELLDEEEESSGEDAFYLKMSAHSNIETGSPNDEEPVQIRQSTSSRQSKEARKTLRLEFLETAKFADEEPPPLPPRGYIQSKN
ncbi:phosphoinositide 3-kinase adapter protein 1-like [Pecten maximus]|uniref:phosphoinositide 3-kinase adapter protein 1-like n=1 Tax=Pecten maximus TaxID=6579 RepID=UPI0014587C60|nr:phosphoinositide 3-kinase adapter protein 1-like [Pecten maximus]